MSITWKLRKWVEDNRSCLYMGWLSPYEVGTIADEIDAEHKRLTDKAHADGEHSAMKQVRSKSVDYRKGYEQAMKDVERTMDERKTDDERTKTEQNGVGSSKVRAGSSITEELRESMSPCISDGWLTITKSTFEKVADRIDEQYAVKVERLEKYRAAVCAMLKEYVKLPVDADGVPIRVGDEMDVGTVFAIGDEGVFMVENGFSGKYDVECFDGFACHHVQPDTWERIIGDACDMASRCCDDDAGKAELVERCRRLAGESE